MARDTQGPQSNVNPDELHACPNLLLSHVDGNIPGSSTPIRASTEVHGGGVRKLVEVLQMVEVPRHFRVLYTSSCCNIACFYLDNSR